MKRPSFKGDLAVTTNAVASVQLMQKSNRLGKAKWCSQEVLMQTRNQDHLAGPFGCVFTLLDSQPWTRNMLANS